MIAPDRFVDPPGAVGSSTSLLSWASGLRAGRHLYGATKFAVRVLTEGLRMKLRADKISCTMISPGAVATELPESSSGKATRKNLR